MSTPTPEAPRVLLTDAERCSVLAVEADAARLASAPGAAPRLRALLAAQGSARSVVAARRRLAVKWALYRLTGDWLSGTPATGPPRHSGGSVT